MWDPIVPILRSLDIEPITVDLPSTHLGGDLRDDVRVVRDLVLAQDRETVLVGHSYGGIVISEAVAELPSVQHLVYLCAFMLDVGESLIDAVGGPVDWLDIDQTAGTITAADPQRVFYGDLPAELTTHYADRLRPQSIASFAQPLTTAAWRDVDSTYLVCSHDEAIPPALQRAMAARATHQHELASSHSPVASSPQEVAALVAGAAGR
jgi:pimeloyl-ACP methyl ester carboxylesterase